MILRIKKLGMVTSALTAWLMPIVSMAQESGGVVPCGNGDPSDPAFVECDYGQFIQLIENFMEFAFKLAWPIVLIAILYAGFMFIASANNPGRRTDAKKVLVKILTGVVVIVAAWFIVAIVLQQFGVNPDYIFLDI